MRHSPQTHTVPAKQDPYTNLTKLRGAMIEERRALVQRILQAPKVTLEHAELICYLQWAIEAVDVARRDEVKE
jgi:hypothetical protein